MRAIILICLAALAGCGGAGSTNGTSSLVPTATATATPTPGDTSYVAAYKAAKWSGVTVSFPTSCTMTLQTTGTPAYHSDYYLAPDSTQYPTTVATTPVSNTPMSLVPFTLSSIVGQTVTLNTCPSKAVTTTNTNMGAIGYMLTGEALFNAYEGNGFSTPAMSDNVSYTFTNNGTSETASFIDQCNSHPTPLSAGYMWHYHGVPSCLTAQVDGATGPSHLIGIALDGYPIYGGRDINGNIIPVSQLDSCNGITSPTPEFPNGVYHYVLPIGVTSGRSSLNCYTGTP
ncbi:MAG: YHYH protein [Vulcanimicrobiaceae bacterium]